MHNEPSKLPNSHYRSPGAYILDFYKTLNYPAHEPLWLNLGLWNSGDTYCKACENLTNWIIDAAQFKEGTVILDVGSGFCQPAIFIAQKNSGLKIHSINIQNEQIEIARSRISKLSLSKTISVSKCSATELDFAGQSFDVVFALESAFHFDTREKFLLEAYRVLKPKGRLIMADMLASSNLQIDQTQKTFIKNYGVPVENLIDINTFRNQLVQSQFKIDQLFSVKENVYPFAAQLSKQLSEGNDLYSSKVYISEADKRNLLGIELWDNIGLSDFILACAEKV